MGECKREASGILCCQVVKAKAEGKWVLARARVRFLRSSRRAGDGRNNRSRHFSVNYANTLKVERHTNELAFSLA